MQLRCTEMTYSTFYLFIYPPKDILNFHPYTLLFIAKKKKKNAIDIKMPTFLHSTFTHDFLLHQFISTSFTFTHETITNIINTPRVQPLMKFGRDRIWLSHKHTHTHTHKKKGHKRGHMLYPLALLCILAITKLYPKAFMMISCLQLFLIFTKFHKRNKLWIM